ncbi:hypothetical protein EBZ37_14195, partial [bacterium]|nr:hypothetical protein [bacterium]
MFGWGSKPPAKEEKRAVALNSPLSAAKVKTSLSPVVPHPQASLGEVEAEAAQPQQKQMEEQEREQEQKQEQGHFGTDVDEELDVDAGFDVGDGDDAIFQVDPETNVGDLGPMLMLGDPVDPILENVCGSERFTFPDEEPVDDEDYFQFSPRHGVVRAKHKHNPHPAFTSHQSHVVTTATNNTNNINNTNPYVNANVTAAAITLAARGGAMAKQMNLAPALLRKQLESTLKKLSVALRDKAILQERLDNSGLTAEVDKMQGLLSRQDEELSLLAAENRSLQKALRQQTKLITDYEKRDRAQRDKDFIVSPRGGGGGGGGGGAAVLYPVGGGVPGISNSSDGPGSGPGP